MVGMMAAVAMRKHLNRYSEIHISAPPRISQVAAV
jgi:hypothetical protein